jgi:hypothetical protein
MPTRRRRQRDEPRLVGLASIDALSVNTGPDLQDYINAVAEYVRQSGNLTAEDSKAAQISLSAGLGRCLREALTAANPRMQPQAGEVTVAGALRTARADVSDSHQLDGLRLAVEIKPVNLAVGRAIWNRFGDVRAFAVNIHLKFPFAVVGGVLALPTWEWAKLTRRMQREAAEQAHAVSAVAEQDDTDELPLESTAEDRTELVDTEDDDAVQDEAEEAEAIAASIAAGTNLYKKPTIPLLDRLVARLQRTRLRETEADAPHLLEAIGVLIYDPDTATLLPDLPPVGSGLRWDEFVQTLAETYELRFEE